MSNDKDFFRYKPEVPGIIYNYELDEQGYIHFKYKEKPDPEKMPEDRKLIWPLPKTVNKLPGFARILIKNDYNQLFGNPSALVRFTGNPHEATKPLREALLAHLGIENEIFERYPYWDEKFEKVLWYQGFVRADPKEIKLLKDPIATYDKYFRNTKYDDIEKLRFDDCTLKNHLFSLKTMICAMSAIVLGKRMTDVLIQFEK